MKKLVASLAIFCAISISAQSTHSGICFVQAPGSPFPGGNNPGNVTSADFNSDGQADLAVCNYPSNSVSIYLNNPVYNGSFTLNSTISAGGATYVIAADFNADGKKDLAIGTGGAAYSIRIYFGNGNATFSAPTVYNAINYGVIYMAAADFNNDGATDIIATTIGGSHFFYVLMNNGAGVFTSTKLYAGLTDDVTCVGTADVNGDARQDATFPAGSTTMGRLADVALGNGAGGFSSIPYTSNTTYYNVPGGGNQHMVFGDFNEDGKQDIAELLLDPNGNGSTSLSSVYVSLNSGVSPYFTSWTTFAVGTDPGFVGTGDFNMDNHLDLVVLNQASNNLSVLAGNGTGTFAAAVNFSAGRNPTSLTINDFNGDGFSDVAITNNQANTITVLLNAMPKVVANNVTVCSNPNPINLNASVTGADTYTYLWSNGATALNTSATQPTPGVYNNTFVATNSTAQCSTTNIVALTVNPNPTPFTVAPATICAGSSATLVVNPSSWHTSYSWSPSSTLNQSTGTSVIASPPTTTNYNINAVNTFGCTASAATTVTVRTKPEVRYGPSPLNGDITTFYSSINGNSYTWNVSTYAGGNLSFSGQGTNSISNVSWPTFCTQARTLQMISVNVDGCNSTQFIAPMCANGNIYNFPITGAATVLPGSTQSYGIQNGSIPLILPVTWYVDGGTILSGQGTANVSIKWDKGYFGKIAFASTNGTIGHNGALTVAVCNSTPVTNPFSSNCLTVCKSLNSTVLNAGNAGSSYLWNTGANTQNITVTAPVLALENYYYATITNTSGCKSSFMQGVYFDPGCRMQGATETENIPAGFFYPNPASTSVTLRAAEGQVLGAVVVYNMYGQEVHCENILLNEAALDISGLPAGMYSVFAAGMQGKLIKE